jgi:hypothetical protein
MDLGMERFVQLEELNTYIILPNKNPRYEKYHIAGVKSVKPSELFAHSPQRLQALIYTL